MGRCRLFLKHPFGEKRVDFPLGLAFVSSIMHTFTETMCPIKRHGSHPKVVLGRRDPLLSQGLKISGIYNPSLAVHRWVRVNLHYSFTMKAPRAKNAGEAGLLYDTSAHSQSFPLNDQTRLPGAFFLIIRGCFPGRTTTWLSRSFTG